MPSVTRTAATALLGAATAAAHGHVVGLYTADGEFNQGWDPPSGMGYNGNYPDVAAWSTTVQDDGFVSKESYSTPEIACHRGAKPAALSVEVAAGDVLTLEWSTWPDDHHGPVMDYLAPCPQAGCTEADPESLEWFKIDEVGCQEPGTGDDGVWGSDLLIGNGNKWQVQIPEGIAAGGYVLRHEILSLHELGQPQNYPQCFNIEVKGGGSERPGGVATTDLYAGYEDFDIYQPFERYPIPGPDMIAGASPILEQGSGEAAPSESGGAAPSESGEAAPSESGEATPEEGSGEAAPEEPSYGEGDGSYGEGDGSYGEGGTYAEASGAASEGSASDGPIDGKVGDFPEVPAEVDDVLNDLPGIDDLPGLDDLPGIPDVPGQAESAEPAAPTGGGCAARRRA